MKQNTNWLLRVCRCLFITGSLSGTLAQAQSWAVLKARADSLDNKLLIPEAHAAHKLALRQSEVEFGINHVHYGETLCQIGILLNAQGHLKAAEDTLLLAQQIFKQVGSPADTLLGLNYEQLAVCYRLQNQFAKSESTFLGTLSYWEKLLGKANAYYAKTQLNFGNLYGVQGQPTKALPLFLDVLAYHKASGGLSPFEYTVALNGAATAYNQLDQPEKAEPLLLDSQAICKKINSPEVVFSQNSLAVLYERMGESEKGLVFSREAVGGIATYKPGSVAHATMLMNMALCLVSMGRHPEADSLYRQTLAIYRQMGFTKSVSYANTLLNQATLRYAEGKFADALAMLAEAMSIAQSVIGRKSVLYVRLLANSGVNSLALGKYARADSLFNEALAINDSLAGPTSLDHAQNTMIQSMGRYKTGQLSKAIAGIDTSITLYKQRIRRQFLYATNGQKDAFLARWSAAAPIYYTISWQQKLNPHLAAESYSLAMFLKNLLLNEQQQLSSTIRQSNSTRLIGRLDSVQQLSKLMVQQYSLPSAKRLSLDSLETKADLLEKELAQQSAPFRNAQQTIQATWQDVQRALKPNEAAVEFMHFQYHNGQKITDSTLYMALVLRPGWSAPKLVPLTHEKALANLLSAPAISLTASLKPLRARQQTLLNTGQLTQGEALYQLIWQPLDSLLQGVRQVWVSPSGLLHKVALAALPYPGNQPRVLADRYALRQVNTTRALTTATPTRWTAQSRARLYGGITYATDSTGRANWSALPGTQREVEAIGQLLGSSATVVTGQQATKNYLVAQPTANVLHLATHGFFQSPDSSRTDFVRSAAERTLRRSGVVLAGANRPSGTDNGILSGQELANLNLTGTDLVVLSGCDTGLGDIRGSEGVFGLQRAVKMAGAKNLLMSLWPVPDGSTSQFMTAFYKNWRTGKPLHEAFAQTQQQFRKAYPPAVWAAFVLVE